MVGLGGDVGKAFLLIAAVFLEIHLFIPAASSSLVNVTIDDTFGDPITGFSPAYFPNDATWHAGSADEDCTGCKIRPQTLDISQIHNGTWHDGTHTPGQTPLQITLNFTGTALYVYNIVPNFLGNDTATYANISFTLDGSTAGSYLHPPDLTTGVIQYNQLILSITGLRNVSHTLVMTSGGDTKCLVLFDYAIYTMEVDDTSTTPTPSPSSTMAPSPSSSSATTPSLLSSPDKASASPKKHTGAVVGGVIGGVVLILLVAIALVMLHRRRVQRDGQSGPSIEPYRDEPPTREYRAPGRNSSSGETADGVSNSTFSVPGGGTWPWLLDTPSGQGNSQLSSVHITSGSETISDIPGTTGTGVLKRREVISERIGMLQREMSTLSRTGGDTSVVGSESSSGGRSETTIRALEEEVASLRAELASFSAQYGQNGGIERLPAYGEE